MSRIPVSAPLEALILLAVPEEEREQFIVEMDIENMSVQGTAEGGEGSGSSFSGQGTDISGSGPDPAGKSRSPEGSGW